MNTAMHGIKKYIVTAVACCFVCAAFAQDARTAAIRWTSTESIYLRTDSTTNVSFEIETSATEITIRTGALEKLFEISSMTGEWSDVNTTGMLTYELQFGEKQGSAVLERANGVWSFVLDFSNYQDGIRQKFILSDKQLIP